MKSKGEIVLICAIIGFFAGFALLIPPVRQFLFHHSEESAGPSSGTEAGIDGVTSVEMPRNQFPMAQYTVPTIFKKMRFLTDEKDGSHREIFYYWYSPVSHYPAGTRFPLVVVLHDKAGNDFGAVYLRRNDVQKDFPAFLLIPQSPKEKVWSAPKKFSGQEFPEAPAAVSPDMSQQSLPDVINLLARVTEAVPVDESRLYIVGCDEGGTGVYGAAVNYPGVFAGGVEMGGMWSFLDAAKLAKMPLLLLQGLADTEVAPEFTRNMDQIVKNAGGHVFLGEFKDTGHECESPSYYSHAVWQWLFSQRRVVAPAPAAQVVQTPAIAPPAAVPVAQ